MHYFAAAFLILGYTYDIMFFYQTAVGICLGLGFGYWYTYKETMALERQKMLAVEKELDLLRQAQLDRLQAIRQARFDAIYPSASPKESNVE